MLFALVATIQKELNLSADEIDFCEGYTSELDKNHYHVCKDKPLSYVMTETKIHFNDCLSFYHSIKNNLKDCEDNRKQAGRCFYLSRNALPNGFLNNDNFKNEDKKLFYNKSLSYGHR